MALAATNPKIKQLRRLCRRRSSRYEHGLFVIEGSKLLNEALLGGWHINELFYSDSIDRAHLPLAVAERLDSYERVYDVSEAILAGALSAQHPEPIAGIASMPTEVGLESLIDQALTRQAPLVVAVEVGDPGNFGTILRTVEASGAVGVVAVGSSVDPFSPKVVRSASGSLFRCSVATAELNDVTTRLAARSIDTYATAMDAQLTHDQASLGGPFALYVGNESHGLSQHAMSICDHTVTIPMVGNVESLNVAMATSIVLFEAARQRRNASQ